MDHHMAGPLLGNLIIIAMSGAITVGCFIAMFWMLFRPGEKDRHHPKYDILRDDR
jgi:cbb3-type cytochrome oxidase subunit 3